MSRRVRTGYLIYRLPNLAAVFPLQEIPKLSLVVVIAGVID